MMRWTKSALTALAMMTNGCAGEVVSPGGGGGGAAGAGAQGTASALAMRYGSLSPASLAALGPFVTDQPPQDPDALVLFFSDRPQTCGDPVMPPLDGPGSGPSCGDYPDGWQTVLLVPPALDRPGLVDLADFRVEGYGKEIFGGGGCGWGGGPGPQGRLDIVSSDAASLTLDLSDGVRALNTVIDGHYVAQRCDAPPPPAPPAPALAFPGATYPPPPGAPEPEPASLYVVVGSATETCADAWPSVECQNAWRLTFTLPPSLQKPGTVDLSDPALAAVFTAGDPYSAPCGATDHALAEGTITLTSIDASGVTFVVSGSRSYQYGDQLGSDGLYAASFCP